MSTVDKRSEQGAQVGQKKSIHGLRGTTMFSGSPEHNIDSEKLNTEHRN